jgi:hypothetical protein
VRKRTLDEVEVDKRLEHADDTYAAADKDAVSSDEAHDCGDAVRSQDMAPPMEGHQVFCCYDYARMVSKTLMTRYFWRRIGWGC